jgi:nucleoside-triphosphatase
MSKRVAVTGAPGTGKSTLIRRVLDRLNCRAGGVLAREIRLEGKRVGFEIKDLLTEETGTLASVEGEGPMLGRYRVNLHDLERIGAKAIERAVREADLVVIDEVGPMELFSDDFVEAVEAALGSDKPMLVVVHLKSRHHLAKRIREEFTLFIVTEKNRDDLVEEIASELSSLI